MKKKRHYTKPMFRAQREREVVEAEKAAIGEAAELGETVSRRPATFGRGRMSGKVVYVHPAGRFHVVELKTRGGGIRECFWEWMHELLHFLQQPPMSANDRQMTGK